MKTYELHRLTRSLSVVFGLRPRMYKFVRLRGSPDWLWLDDWLDVVFGLLAGIARVGKFWKKILKNMKVITCTQISVIRFYGSDFHVVLYFFFLLSFTESYVCLVLQADMLHLLSHVPPPPPLVYRVLSFKAGLTRGHITCVNYRVTQTNKLDFCIVK